VSKHPKVDSETKEVALKAYREYLKKNLPLLDPELTPEQVEDAVRSKYGVVLDGGVLEGDGKPGDREAKIKMHVKTVSSAAKAISNPPSEDFYQATQDVLLPYLDSLHGSSIDASDHSIFTKLTRKYEERFFRDVRDLNVLDPDTLTRVTEYGEYIAEFVDKIVKNKFAYQTSDGSIYFDIQAFEKDSNHYARLEPWNRNDKSLQADGEGALSQKTTGKRSDADFALWKASKPGEPAWPSVWGNGRPGWHIECSAMASDTLGETLDIHSGGIDLAFPHHDNEIAQSEAYWNEHGAEKKQWVNYFLHMGHLSIQGSKMSKSLKNFTTIREALERGDWTPRSLRVVFLLGGWKEGIEITDDLVKAGSAWEDKLNVSS
jgi:cysteinyl-tRNA synthetase